MVKETHPYHQINEKFQGIKRIKTLFKSLVFLVVRPPMCSTRHSGWISRLCHPRFPNILRSYPGYYTARKFTDCITLHPDHKSIDVRTYYLFYLLYWLI